MILKKGSIIMALVSFACGIVLPHVVYVRYFSQVAELLFELYDHRSNRLHYDRNKFAVTSKSTTNHHFHPMMLPLSIYQNESEYYDVIQTATMNQSTDGDDDDDSSSSISIPPQQQQQQYPCTAERLQDFLYHNNETIKGYHVICFTRSSDDDDKTTSRYTVTAYRYGTERNTYTTTIVPRQMAWSEFQTTIISNRLVKTSVQNNNTPQRNKKKQPYALYTVDGQRILDEASVEPDNNNGDDNTSQPWWVNVLATQFGMILLYEGGQFVWPGIHIGYERQISLHSIMPVQSRRKISHSRMVGQKEYNPPIKNVTLVTISISPLVLSVHGFLSVEECQHIQNRAIPTMAYSDVVLMDKDAGRPASDFRTSQTTFLDAHDDATLVDIDYRTASLIRIPRNHQEPVQVLRYGVTEKYSSHHDYFDPKSYKNDQETMDLIQYGKRNRFVTVFWYLSTVNEGGETIFPRAYGNYETNSNDCDTGLKVRPELGKVILFYNMKMDGTVDSNSLHGACPVRNGIKWAANKWVWNEPMSYVPS